QTDVYQSVATTNEVEDKYARNEVARKALLGPLSIIIKCLGFDSTISLFKQETRGRVFAWIATPLSLIGIFVLLGNMHSKMEEVEGFGSLSWKWGETFILFFLSLQSLVAAFFIMGTTNSLFFLQFHDAWSECVREKEKEKKGENGDAENGGSSHFSLTVPPSPSSRPILVSLSFLFFSATTVAASIKYATFNGFTPVANGTATFHLLDKLKSLEPLRSLWGSLLTATALSICGVLHGIIQITIDDFNKDLKAASDSKTLSTRLDSFSIRYQSLLVCARILSSNLGTFTTFVLQTAVGVNFAAMFLSLAYKGEPGWMGNICIILWTIVSIAPQVVLLLQPAEVQNKVSIEQVEIRVSKSILEVVFELNETNEILLADKEIWSGDVAVRSTPIPEIRGTNDSCFLQIAQQAQMLLSKRKFTDSTVSVFKCLKLTPWVANGLMLVAPIIGGSLTMIKLYIINAIKPI
ncbi:hypothetical protein PMAYCL1PPCAC_17908, partial [Pristionchus mayeri]